jgi:hypothetical protein
MTRLALFIATLAPSFIQLFHVTLEHLFSKFCIDLIVLFTQPNAQILPRFRLDWFLFNFFGKVGSTPRTRIESSNAGKEVDHEGLIFCRRTVGIPSSLIVEERMVSL